MNKAKWFWLGLFIGYSAWMYLPMPQIYIFGGRYTFLLLFTALTIGFFAREFVDWIVKKPWLR